jgi:GT2 family glycosyltransferase
MLLSYRIPPGVSEKNFHDHPALTTKQGGLILLDNIMLDIWHLADGRDLDDILASSPLAETSTFSVSAALACLAEAGLLVRHQENHVTSNHETVTGPLVSIILVSYNSQSWLEVCLPTIIAQNYTPYEIILVDNGSTDDSIQWVAENFPSIKLKTLNKTQSLSKAINLGVNAAKGEFYLLLNPDLKLDPDAIANLVSIIQGDPICAAVAPKLKLMITPAFLNGLGNFVGSISWGTDSALGHLDLGQFDDWNEIPSACFAATLVSASAWKEVGTIDEGFPLYYEDSEWCYRARLLGYTVRAAPGAVIYHAFGSRTSSDEGINLTPEKLQYVAYGRLRFATKILSPSYFLRFLSMYLLEDSINIIYSLFRGRWKTFQAYFLAWTNYIKKLPELWNERKVIQSKRKCPDINLFSLQKNIPMSLIQGGYPLLTWDIVRQIYLPILIGSGHRTIPEFDTNSIQDDHTQAVLNSNLLKRMIEIYRIEGIKGLLFRIGRFFHWKLIHP